MFHVKQDMFHVKQDHFFTPKWLEWTPLAVGGPPRFLFIRPPFRLSPDLPDSSTRGIVGARLIASANPAECF